MEQNLFDECYTPKRSNVKVKNLQNYAKKCEKITYGCDELKMISQGAFLEKCPCFNIYNWTNSKENSLDCSKFTDCIFDSISITLDVFDSCLLYKVWASYNGKGYNLMDFRFHDKNSKKAKVNGYISDILIHGKAWRLQVVSGGKFNIMDFLVELITYDVKYDEKYLVALGEYYITRFDFRIDFWHDNKVKHLKYDDVFTFSARKDKDNVVVDKHSKKFYTGWVAGDRKDRYIYTRMYQKQIEALDKGHGELYIDYLEYPGKVWRLEFEFLSRFTTARKKISFTDEFVNHELTKQIFEYIGLSEKHGYFSKPKNVIEVPFDSLTAYQKKRFISQLKNGAIRLHKAGINPYIVVNQAFRDYIPSCDRQFLESTFDDSIWTSESYDDIMKRIESSKNTTKELYDRIYRGQLGVDL